MLHGIPGTIGGAVRMNAGAYGGEIKDIIESVTYIDYDTLETKTINNEDIIIKTTINILHNLDIIE